MKATRNSSRASTTREASPADRRLLRDPDGRRDRGAAVVEFALIGSLLLLLLGGITDYGMALNASRRAEANATAAARQGAAAADNRLADYTVIRALRALYASTGEDIIRVSIHRSADGSTGPPAGCASGTGVPGVCNVYTGTQVASLTASDFTATDCTGDPDANWCPADRRVAFDADDYLGVTVWIRHDTFFPATPVSDERTATAAFRMEFID